MRSKRIKILLLILGLFLLPFLEITSIQPALADEIEPPGEEQEIPLKLDEITDDVGDEDQPESSPEIDDYPEIIDQTLGLTPQSLPQTEVGQASGVDDSPQALPSPSNESGSAIDSLNYNPVSGMHVLDNFNRTNGSLGPGWTVHDGTLYITGNTVVGSGRATFNSAPGEGNTAEADVASVGTATQFTGLLLNYGAGVDNLFLKVQQQDGSGKFEWAGCYTGYNFNGFGLGFFHLDSPFTTAHMKATRVGDTVTLVFSYIDGGTQPSQTYVCDGAPPREGDGIGILGFQGIAELDNFAVRGGCDEAVYDNGPLVTHEGVGFGGADVSVLQTDLGMNILGFGHQFSLGYRMADDFTIDGPAGWQVNEVTFFAYQLNSTTTPTINGVYFQIWDGPPDNPGSNIVFGDLVTNRLVSTNWTGIYRVADYDMPNVSRPVMANVASAGVFLPPGTYWLDWMTDGSLTSGPWATPISVLGDTTTGNAMQYVTSWNPAIDTGTTTQQGMPFLIQGCEEEILWNQPVSQAYPSNFFANQHMPDYPDHSAFIADDFIVEVPWSIETIFIPGGWHSNANLANASEMVFLIFEDDGGIPTGALVWELSLPVTDPHLTLYLGSLGSPTDTLLSLPVPLVLPSGHYWLIAFPTLDFYLYGQYGRPQADTCNGYMAQWINPGGGFGVGTGWQDWTVIPAVLHDAAFRLSGEFKIYLPLIMK